MDAAQWAKDVRNDGSYNQVQEKKAKPQDQQAVNCPRCNSTNTKFCYYNNYSLTQPRYYCKACKRYWTKGGSLRSVPVGGGSRKNKRTVHVSTATSSMSKPIDLSQFSSQNFTTHEVQDLNLGSQATKEDNYHNGFSQFMKLQPKIETSNANFLSSSVTSTTDTTSHLNTMFNETRFGVQDFKPMMGFPIQGNNGITYGNFLGNVQEGGERIMLPFGVLNQQHSTRENGESMGQGNLSGYWNETLDGGSSALYN